MRFDTSHFVYALVTSTTYGNWLPGDDRGFVGDVVENGKRENHNTYNTPCDKNLPNLKRYAKEQLKSPPVLLHHEQAESILAQWQETAAYLSWHLFAVAVMPNHFHLVVAATEGTDKTALLKRFKSYASRALNEKFGKKTWWTASGSVRFCFDEDALNTRIQYVLKQENPLVVWENSMSFEGQPPD